MKAIRNRATLIKVLSAEDLNWQQRIYDRTSVILFLHEGYDELFSNCGCIDLDYDADYVYRSGVDETQYCEITNIDELVDYIKAMDSFSEYLANVSFGQFSKAELFWAIYAKIIDPAENQSLSYDGLLRSDWALDRIHPFREHTELCMALVDYDETRIELNLRDLSLEEALICLVEKLNELTDDLKDVVPRQTAFQDKQFTVPSTYNELLEKLQNTFSRCNKA